MAKEAYYFSHDSNARHDPKITAMRSVYGTEGYGWFWILIELMREANGYKLDMQGRYTFNAYAMQMHTDCTTAERFIHDCINEFELFQSDDCQFWSPSLLRRMEMREEISEKKRQAALKRWGNKKKNADGMHMHSTSNADGMQGKESKLNKSKGKENKEKKIPYADNVLLTEREYENLCSKFGKEMTDQSIEYLSSYKIEKNYKTKSDNLTIQRWVIDAVSKSSRSSIKPVQSKQQSKPTIITDDIPEERVSDDEYERILNKVRSIDQRMRGVV